MSAALSFAEIEGQHAELLPARTVLSLFRAGGTGGTATGTAAGTAPAGTGTAAGTSPGVAGGPGGVGEGTATVSGNSLYSEGDIIFYVIGGDGGTGGAVTSGGGPITGTAG